MSGEIETGKCEVANCQNETQEVQLGRLYIHDEYNREQFIMARICEKHIFHIEPTITMHYLEDYATKLTDQYSKLNEKHEKQLEGNIRDDGELLHFSDRLKIRNKINERQYKTKAIELAILTFKEMFSYENRELVEQSKGSKENFAKQ